MHSVAIDATRAPYYIGSTGRRRPAALERHRAYRRQKYRAMLSLREKKVKVAHSVVFDFFLFLSVMLVLLHFVRNKLNTS